MANNQFTNEDRKLFHKIETDIKKNCVKYSEAGKWLDQFYDVAKFWQEKVEHLQTLNETCKSHKECECEFCEEAEWLSWVIEKRNFISQDEYIEISDTEQEFREGLFKEEVPAIYRLLEAKSELTSKYISNCGMLSEQDAKCIYLTNWLLTSPESRNDTDIEITKFQRYELKELEGIIYSRMGLLFSTQRNIEEWIKMIKTAQHRLDFEKENKTKPASPKKSAEKADKQDKVTPISQPDSILGDTWSILGIPINVKKLRTKLKSHPFLLCCCLSLIVIIATYPLWHPLINKTDHSPTASTSIFADVSKDGSISRSNNFPWDIEKTKDKDGNILYTIVDRRGDATAVSVVPDNPKYTVYQSWDGMVIKYTCPEEKISNFTIKLKY